MADDLGRSVRLDLVAPGNPAQMTLTSQSGHIYVLEASPDLINWTPVRTNTATGPTLILNDPDPNAELKRFYRARQL